MPHRDPPPTADPIDPAWLRSATGLVAFEHLAETGSTMDRAREFALGKPARLPALIVADRQTAGRGQRAARWWQAPDSLTMSLVVDADLVGGSSGPKPTWSLACGVALAEAIRACEPRIAPQVRWPNDVEIDGRKLAGILVETAGHGRVIFGVGVNTTGSACDAPVAIRQRIATLPDTTGRPLARQRLLGMFLPRLFGLLADIAADPTMLADRYRPLCSLVGTDVAVHAADGIHRGRCLGIATDGRLLLQTEAGLLAFVSGSLTAPGDVWRGDA